MNLNPEEVLFACAIASKPDDAQLKEIQEAIDALRMMRALDRWELPENEKVRKAEAILMRHAVSKTVDAVRQQLQIILSNAGILKFIAPMAHANAYNKIEAAVDHINKLIYEASK